MATPRKRWFRVGDKIGRKAWTNDELASLIRLMAYLNGRWAREGIDGPEAGYAEVSIADLMGITGKRRADVARKSAERWRDIAEISVQHRGDITVILWPKFPVFQGMVAPSQADPGTKRAPSATRDTRPAARVEESGPRASQTPRSPALPESALECSDLLIELLRPVPGAVIPRGARTSWAREIVRLAETCPELAGNGADPQPHIEAGIRWALGPENLGQPYEVVIRSGRSLREKWPKLVAAARRRRVEASDPIGDWLKSQGVG